MIQERDVKANGIRFRIRECGQGPLVLCLHGFPDTPHSFDSILLKLKASGYHVVAPFMRGYFPSDIPEDGDYSLVALGNDVVQLISALGYEKAHIVGHDWGASAAYTAAALAPEKILSMVTAAVPHLRSVRLSLRQLILSWYILFFQIPWLPEFLIRRRNYKFINFLYKNWSPNYAGWDLSAIKSILNRDRVKAVISYYRSLKFMGPSQWKTVFAPLRIKPLVIGGGADRSIGISLFENVGDGFERGCYFIEMEHEGHFMHIEKKELFAQYVADFINSNTIPPEAEEVVSRRRRLAAPFKSPNMRLSNSSMKN